MPRARGIHSHPLLKLGKAPARRDARNLRLADVLRDIRLPREYDFDVHHFGIPLPMFGNAHHGDCVMAGRAHQTLRFERLETGKVIHIRDGDVLREYRRQAGPGDNGLTVLDSLKEWRKRGWRVGKHRYRIRAFAELDPRDRREVKTAIFLDVGIGMGLQLPNSAKKQIVAGKPWAVARGPAARSGSWGGHYVYVSGYTELGPMAVTWGRKQQMTWAFVERYCDEAYAIVDRWNTHKKRRGLDRRRVEEFLRALS
ncbi:MAG: hypothetical protein ACM3OB_05635 [Acidobacteriota bacterium]